MVLSLSINLYVYESNGMNKLSRSAFFYCENAYGTKCTPQLQQILSLPTPPLPPLTPTHTLPPNRKVITFQAKGLGAGQDLPCRDWAGVLPTQTLLGTNLATPESLILIDLTIQESTNIFQNKVSH